MQNMVLKLCNSDLIVALKSQFTEKIIKMLAHMHNKTCIFTVVQKNSQIAFAFKMGKALISN